MLYNIRKRPDLTARLSNNGRELAALANIRALIVASKLTETRPNK